MVIYRGGAGGTGEEGRAYGETGLNDAARCRGRRVARSSRPEIRPVAQLATDLRHVTATHREGRWERVGQSDQIRWHQGQLATS